MPLSPAAPRKPLNTRCISCHGYQRDDGLWEVEGHLCNARGFDIRTRWRGPVPKGTPFHEMGMRITFGDDMVIRAIEVVTDAAPYPATCASAPGSYQRLVGLRIGGGFSRRIVELVGGTSGCTHQTELLRVLGSVAMQTVGSYHAHVTKDRTRTARLFGNKSTRPGLLESCVSYATDTEVVATLWPDHYSGPTKN